MSKCGICGDNSTCQVCHGSGHIQTHLADKTCKHCDGSGNCPR